MRIVTCEVCHRGVEEADALWDKIIALRKCPFCGYPYRPTDPNLPPPFAHARRPTKSGTTKEFTPDHEKKPTIETYYNVLGVARDTGAADIKAAYRRQALRWHPDKNLGSKEAEERFKIIAEAYTVLSNPQTRKEYDTILAAGGSSLRGASFEADVAAAMFTREMMNLAAELTFQNIPWSRIVPELMSRGCPEAVARQIAQATEHYRKDTVRKAATDALVKASLWLGLGLVVTAGSYLFAQPGERYLITIGIFIVAGGSMLRALFYLLTGRVPDTEFTRSTNRRGVGSRRGGRVRS